MLDAIGGAAAVSSSIEELALAGCELDGADATALAAALNAGRLAHLTSLNVSNNADMGAGACDVLVAAASCGSVAQLDLSGTGAGRGDIGTALVEALACAPGGANAEGQEQKRTALQVCALYVLSVRVLCVPCVHACVCVCVRACVCVCVCVCVCSAQIKLSSLNSRP